MGLINQGKGALSAIKAARAKPAETIDPLAQAVAARMIGQLNALPQVSGLETLKGVNLPAAYAGDQRSMQAAQRAINKAETGLESPGRRKMMKQSAAMAARQAVPDAIVDAVGAGALRKAAIDTLATPTIPTESIQAAIAAEMDKVLGLKALQRFAKQNQSSLLPSDLGITITDVQQLADEGIKLTPKEFDEIQQAFSSLRADRIAEAYGLPVEVIEAHLKKSGTNPIRELDQHVGERVFADAYYGDGYKSQRRDYGFDEFQGSDDEFQKAISDVRKHLEFADEDLYAYEPMYEAYVKGLKKQRFGPTNELMGRTAVDNLSKKYSRAYGNPLEQRFDMIDHYLDEHSDDVWNGIQTWVNGE